MIRRLRYILLVALFCGCTSSQLETQSAKTNDLKKKLQGVWAKSDTVNISFEVIGDSLRLFEDPGRYFFEIKKDSFIYYFDGIKYIDMILVLQSDSLVLIENGDTLTLHKMR